MSGATMSVTPKPFISQPCSFLSLCQLEYHYSCSPSFCGESCSLCNLLGAKGLSSGSEGYAMKLFGSLQTHSTGRNEAIQEPGKAGSIIDELVTGGGAIFCWLGSHSCSSQALTCSNDGEISTGHSLSLTHLLMTSSICS